MAIAAVTVLPVALVSHAPHLVFWLCACVLLALAVALRWRVGIAGWFGLVGVAVAVWAVVLAASAFGPRKVPYSWILFVVPLVGFLALGWDRAPRHRQA